MSPKKTRTPSGVITFHTPFAVSLLKSEDCTVDLKETAVSRQSPSMSRNASNCVGARKRNETSPSKPQLGTSQALLSHSSLRRVQAKMEAENQEAKRIIQPLLDTENSLVKEIERYFSQRDVTELRRRELLHKHWSENVWHPLQRRVKELVSRCSLVEAKRRQSLYSHYLQHCNTKGFVFLESFDLKEYNPFLLNIRKPYYLKLSTADFKDPFYLQLHERAKYQRTAHSGEAGYKRKLPRPLSDSVASWANTNLQTLSSCPVSTPRKTPGGSQDNKSTRPHNIPYHISVSATPDGRCHRPDCWFSSCGFQQQPVILHQLQPTDE
ncbi:protein FAM228A [Cheilinus undulatus]|uniref:protein FAM228A n=1 Tax=Cheilinus undulatus TaxID=241271 RepID=UPI001BD38DA7|nr:protein FAM228A [Cheilinus undulatus]XP_041660590.1 protein FAM228A [Cheilinus undulatus]